MPNPRIFQQIKDIDIVEDVKKVTTGLFTGGAGELAGSNFVTKSLSSGNKNYYYTLQYKDEDQLGVTFGHMGGSGSDGSNGSLTDLVGETEVIYKQFSSLLLPPASAHKGFVFSGSNTPEQGMYFIVAERARMKDRINKEQWTLQLSGSTGGFNQSGSSYASGTLMISEASGSVGTVQPGYHGIDVTIGSVDFTFVSNNNNLSNTANQIFVQTGSNALNTARNLAGAMGSSSLHGLGISSGSISTKLSGATRAVICISGSDIGTAMNVSASVTGLNGGNTGGVINWIKLNSEVSGTAVALKTAGTYAFGGGTNVSAAGASGSILKLTDNSTDKLIFPDMSPAGPRYDIVSGSNGSINERLTTYGWFYPNRGIWALRQSKLSASLSGKPTYITGSDKNQLGLSASYNGLAMNTAISTNTDNAIKLVKALQNGTQTIRAEEDQAITSYFCRARAHQYNGTTNPTFISGSDGRYLNRDMEGNPQVFITNIGLYNSNYELVAVGSLSKPIQKNWSKEATIKVNFTW